MTNDSIDNLRLDISQSGVNAKICTRKNDTRTRTIHFSLVNKGQIVSMEDAIFAQILIKKPNQDENDQAMVIDGNELQYSLRTQDVNIAGECKCQIVVTYEDGAIITSPPFYMEVSEQVIDQSNELSQNEYTALSEMVVEANKSANNAEASARKALASEQAAGAIESNVSSMQEDIILREENILEVQSDVLEREENIIGIQTDIQERQEDVSDMQSNVAEMKNLVEVSELNALASANNAEESFLKAKASEDRAKVSEDIAVEAERVIMEYEDESGLNAKKAQSYAVGGTDYREDEDTNNAEYFYQQAKMISESFAGALRPCGTIIFDVLPNNAAVGDMYNISNEFVTTDKFEEGAGHTIAAGANVYLTVNHKWDILAGTPLTGVKGAAEEIYRRGNVNISPENIGLGNVDNTSDLDKPISDATLEALNLKADKSDLEDHAEDTDIHISSAERLKWNNLITQLGELQTKVAEIEGKLGYPLG